MATRRRRRPLPVLAIALAAGCLGMVTLAPAANARGGGLLRCLLRGQCGTTTTSSTTTSTSTTTTTTEGSSTSEGSSTTEPSYDECGTVPNPDGGDWHCTFDDEFDGASLDRTKWTPQLTGPGSFPYNTECFVDSPNNIAVGDGVLTLTARKEAAPFDCFGVHSTQYTSGMVSTNPNGSAPGFAQTNGRWEVRAKFTGGDTKPGTQETFWLWPKTYTASWPISGEIDFAELYGTYPDRSIPYIHYDNFLDLQQTNYYCLINDITQYHTYAVDWSTTSLTISYDGQTCLVDRWQSLLPPIGHPRYPFDAPFYLILTQALGVQANAFNPITTPLPASTVVDYVRVWGN
jgi:hypothetical protein